MQPRRTFYGILAAVGAAAGAAATYVAMKPALRKELAKAGFSRSAWNAVQRSVRDDVSHLTEDAKELADVQRERMEKSKKHFAFRFGRAAEEADDLKRLADAAKERGK